ncbi:hypothetical protein, partial [Mesorhizobium sp. LSJC268A00]|uniref:hypothetical protein n=1 Tax=Mesorhizobium sp. LSJC268A00 TaxID=1287325 RepID=UPI001FD90975
MTDYANGAVEPSDQALNAIYTVEAHRLATEIGTPKQAHLANEKGRPEGRPYPFRSGDAGLDYSLMVTTMPAPTVRPPSRMAKR